MTSRTTHKTILAFTLRELWISRGLTVDDMIVMLGPLFPEDKLKQVDLGLYFPRLGEAKALCEKMDTSLGYAVGYADGVAAHLQFEGWEVKFTLDEGEEDTLLAEAGKTHDHRNNEPDFQHIRTLNLFLQILESVRNN